MIPDSIVIVVLGLVALVASGWLQERGRKRHNRAVQTLSTLNGPCAHQKED